MENAFVPEMVPSLKVNSNVSFAFKVKLPFEKICALIEFFMRCFSSVLSLSFRYSVYDDKMFGCIHAWNEMPSDIV